MISCCVCGNEVKKLILHRRAVLCDVLVTIVAISHLLEQMWALAQMNLQAPSKYQGSLSPLGFGSKGFQPKMEGLGPQAPGPWVPCWWNESLTTQVNELPSPWLMFIVAQLVKTLVSMSIRHLIDIGLRVFAIWVLTTTAATVANLIQRYSYKNHIKYGVNILGGEFFYYVKT